MKKHETVHRACKAAILESNLEMLPSIRQAMALFSCSKTTVQHAYDTLVFEGLVKPVPGKGYQVCASARQKALKRNLEKPAVLPEPVPYDFSITRLDPSTFEHKLWRRYLKEVLQDGAALARYGDARGERDLRESLASYVYGQRGLVCTADEIVTGPGFQSLLLMYCLMRGPSTVLVDRHASDQVLATFSMAGWTVKTEGETDCVYVAPESDRDPSLYSAFVLEDDWNGELVMPARPPVCASLPGVYFGSFSQVLLPSLRLSYMVLPQPVSAFPFSPSASKIEQLALARYIADGKLESHVRKLRRHYRKQYECLDALLAFLPHRHNAPYLCIEIEGTDRVLSAMKKAGLKAGMKNGWVQLGYAGLDAGQMTAGMEAFRTFYQSGL